MAITQHVKSLLAAVYRRLLLIREYKQNSKLMCVREKFLLLGF